MNYIGNLFAVPSFLAFVDFFMWAIVLLRMSNLYLPIGLRLFVLSWAATTLMVACSDVARVHYFTTDAAAFSYVGGKTLIRIGNLGLAIMVYRLLAKAYPHRMAASKFEPTPLGIHREVA